MDIRTSWHIRHAARHAMAARWHLLHSPTGVFGVGLAVSIAALGLGESEDVLSEGGLERLAAQVRVHHGDRALAAFQLHAALQILTSNVARGGASPPVLFELLDTVIDASESLHIDGVVGAIDALRDAIRDDASKSTLVERAAGTTSAVDRALGLVATLRDGQVEGLHISYPEAYRIARLLGGLRADDLVARDPTRWSPEMRVAMEVLGCPVGHAADLTADEVSEHWLRVEATLGIVVGGLADEVYRAALSHGLCRELTFPGVALRKALGDLAMALRRLGATALANEVDTVGKTLVGQEFSEEAVEPLDLTVVDRVEVWLEEGLPLVGLEEVHRAQVTLLEARFCDRIVPVTASSIESFIRQFPVGQRWVGRGLLDAVEYRERRQLSRSIGFLLDSVGLQVRSGVAWCGLPSTHELEFRGAELTLPYRALRGALADTTVDTLVFVDDVLLDVQPLLEDLAGLEPKQLQRLKRVSIVFAFSMASRFAVAALRSFIEERGWMGQVLVGESVQRLSDVGWQHCPEIVSEAELANPLFSPHAAGWGARDWREARALCVDIGSALDHPDHALGHRGFQGRLVLGHRVPRSTLTLLWKEGAWMGKAWTPLFSALPQ
jgi:hypothetical protein